MSKQIKIILYRIKQWSIKLVILLFSSNSFGQSAPSNHEQLQHIRAINYEKGQHFKHWVNTIALDNNNLLWVSSYNLLYTFDGVTITERASIQNNGKYLFDRLFLINDTLYLLHQDTPVHYFPNESDEIFIKKAAWNIDIMSHCTTADDRELVSTREGTIFEYKAGRFETLFQATTTQEEEQYNTSQSSLINDANDANKIWFYHKNKLYHIDLSRDYVDEFNCKEEALLDLNYINPHGSHGAALTQLGDAIYLGSVSKGLIRFHVPSKTWKSYNKIISPTFKGNEDEINSVISIVPFNDSVLLLGGTFATFFDIKNQTHIDYLGTNRNYHLPRHGFALKLDDVVFMNNFNGGLSVLTPSNNQFINHFNYIEGDFTSNVTDNLGLSWSCDRLRAYGLNSKGDTTEVFDVINHLGEEVSQHVLVDKNNCLWLGSASGLVRYNVKRRTFRKYTEFDGLAGEDWNTDFSAMMNERGMVLVRSAGLKSRFNPDILLQKEKLSIPYISQVTIQDRRHFNSKTASKNMVLQPDEDFFTLHYSAKNYKEGQQLSFQYKLKGYDQQWIDGDGENKVSYKYLSPGTYNFKVKTKGPSGGQSKTSEDFIIEIKAHWYESWFFKAFLILLVAGIIYGFYKLKTTALKRELALQSKFNETLSQVKLKALRSQMNPHFLFNCLNSIDNFILSNDSQNASEYLGKFSKLIRNILDYSKTNAITLEQELETTEIYIKMEQMRFANKFDYKINVSPTLDQSIKTIPPLILQPYVENAIWHGLLHKDGRGCITITIYHDDEYFIFEIDDNGVGRAKAQAIKTKSAIKRKSHGMQITEERIQLINQLNGKGGTVETIDKVDTNGISTGTKIILKLPIKLTALPEPES